jgi:hypothetical protein
MYYPLPAAGRALFLSDVIDKLRGLAWREHCARATAGEACCIEAGDNCRFMDKASCRADMLFPAALGGGAKPWRMATLFVHYLPKRGAVRLLALGPLAAESVRWADGCLREHFGLTGGVDGNACCLGDLQLPPAGEWTVHFVTPWRVNKHVRQTGTVPSKELIEEELRKALRIRAHKVSALSAGDMALQRFASHLAHHLAAAAGSSLRVETADILQQELPQTSRGNGKEFDVTAWTGMATVTSPHDLSPWLTLLHLCGGGENPDKGFGGVEVITG